MTSYGDILKNENSILYWNKYNPFDSKANSTNSNVNKSLKKYNYVFKANPAKGQSLSQSYYQEHGKQDWKSKNVFNFNIDEVNLELMTSDYKYSAQAAFPLLKDDWKVNADAALYHQPGAERKVEVNASIESPNLSGAELNVDLHWSQLQKFKGKIEKKDGKEVETEPKEWKQDEMECEVDIGCTYEKDIFAGATIDLGEGKFQAAEATLARLDGKNKQWLGYNTNEQVKLGCKVHNDEHRYDHVYEIRYNTNKDAKPKFQGMPMVFGMGCKYALSNKSTLTFSSEWAENVHGFMKWNHKIDNNWALGITQSMDQSQEKKDMYKLSFDVNYNL